MHPRVVSLLALSSTLLAACAGGSPTLEYRVPAPDAVRYAYGDTSTVGISVMGQSMEISQQGSARYAVAFSPAAAGVSVTLTVSELSGTLTQPLGPPVRIDESDVEGALIFSLDRTGNAVIAERPEVEVGASQMVSGFALAHGFFPGLPGRAAVVGDAWVDTVRYEGAEGAGSRSETAILRYTVVGDTAVAGRDLLRIDVEGESETSAELEVAGMTVSQRSRLDIRGWVLWDAEAGLMYERRSESSGRGTASVPMVPNPIPIQVRSHQHARLEGS